MSYPDNFLRGISQQNLLTPDGMGVSAAAFYFDEQHARDEWLEQSICWEDDEGAVILMLKQKKEGAIQFRVGVVRVPRLCVSYINRLPQTKDLLSYERKELDDNRYHGNLLLKKNTHKIRMRTVAAMIAGHVTDVIPQT